MTTQLELPPELQSVEILRLQHGDVLLCKSEHPLPPEVRERIRMELADALPQIGVSKIIVANPGFTISVIRKELLEQAEERS